MIAKVVDEFQVLGRYKVMVLDREVCSEPPAHYRIGGQLFDPIRLHRRSVSDTIPLNYIAVRSTGSFKGLAVEAV